MIQGYSNPWKTEGGGGGHNRAPNGGPGACSPEKFQKLVCLKTYLLGFKVILLNVTYFFHIDYIICSLTISYN